MVAAGCFQSCQQDDFGEVIPDKETLIAQGRYLTARSSDGVTALDDPDKASWFDSGTPYRLLAFTNPYKSEVTTNTPRFNKVAWEGIDDGTGLHFINIDSEPDKWFGFSALSGETAGEGLVSLDFYGFTYGKEEEYNENYIQLEEPTGVQTPDKGKLNELTHREDVSDYSSDKIELSGDLNDLMWGRLLNQNIETAGVNASNATQSIIPFIHAFSRLRFMVVQQSEDDPGENGNPVPCFPDVRINSIKVTHTYGSGSVYLQNGKIGLNGEGQTTRVLSISKEYADKYPNTIPLQQVEIGQMMIYPSDGNCLKDKSDGYDVGLEISVTGTNKTTIEQFLANTNPAGTDNTVSGNDTDGWTGIVVKNSIIDNYTNKAIRFKQNTAYTLVISFQKNSVRIITVIPQVEEWLPGEGTAEDPWQEQAIGQPQMFDNIVWSDRNLGAEHYDPINAKFEYSIGYFFQAGRNIPYYPFKRADYVYNAEHNHPTMDDLQELQHYEDNNTKWGESQYRFYPVVDENILLIGSPEWWVITQAESAQKDGTAKAPQMIIPETRPTDRYFDFMVDNSLGDNDVKWNESPKNQPVSGDWHIPTSDQFMSIFPGTPHAGNFAFKTGGYNNSPMDWGSDDSKPTPYLMDSSVRTLRVTVPYYNPEEAAAKNDPGYFKAWNILNEKHDPGTTHSELYTQGGPKNNINNDPNGDPSDGYASIYVISREEGSVEYLPKQYVESVNSKGKKNFWIKEWGTIYGIKRVYTNQAYRMRWRVFIATEGKENPGYVVEICRYRCTEKDTFDEDNYKKYDWDHPAARIYFPVCGLGDHPGNYINYGLECQYATSDPISKGTTSAVQIKVNGNNTANVYISVVRNVINRHFGMQIRPIQK